MDASVIGSRALSSVVVEKKEAGTGIKVKTQNITYCTTGMYQNALATAGLENAEIRVAGPFQYFRNCRFGGGYESLRRYDRRNHCP